MNWKFGKWSDGERVITGRWYYSHFHGAFYIRIDGKDDLGMDRSEIQIRGDEPNFGNWKLIEGTK